MRRNIDGGVVESHRVEVRELPFDRERIRARQRSTSRRVVRACLIGTALYAVLAWWLGLL